MPELLPIVVYTPELSRWTAGIKPCRRGLNESIDLLMTSFHARCVMNGHRASRFFLQTLVPCCLLAIPYLACGGSTRRDDPQSPTPREPKAAASSVVICPDGSSYDPGRNVCIATSGTPGPEGSRDTASEGSGSLRVKCNFDHAWVAVLPSEDYPDEDELLMAALVGFTQDPDEWEELAEFRGLAKYKAQRCTRRGERFELDSGAHFVLVVDTRSSRAERNNGYRRRVVIPSGETLELDLSSKDLNRTWTLPR